MFKQIKLFPLISCTTLLFSTPCLAQFRSDRPTFFDDGQKFMEQEIRRMEQENRNQQNTTQVEHPSQLLTINDNELTWQKYLFRDAGFSVWMPQGIQSNEDITIETKGGNIKFEVFATQPKSLRFIAAFSEDENLSNIGSNEDILDAVKQGIINKTNFELIQEKAISFESNLGIFLGMKNDEEAISFQIYLVNKKVYVLAVSTKNNNYQQEITSFFNSFRLIE